MTIAGLSLGLGAVGAPMALAEQTEQGVITAAPASTIDFAATGSITVNKSTDPQGERGTGNADYDPKAPLEGVTFELYKIMDIDTAADFALASGYTVATAPEGTYVTSGVTDANGQVVFDNLEVGLYKVVETNAPEGVVMGAPYLVYLPMTNPSDTTEWNYNVVTYPKNSMAEDTVKEVQDADANVGDDITYTITSGIPVVTSNDVTKYEVHDQLDADNVMTSAEQISVALSNGTEFAQGTDYTVTVDTNQKVEIIFTETGLAQLTEAKKADVNAKVVTTIKATVKAIAGTDGVAVNEATVYHNNPYNVNETEERPSNEVKSYWAKLRVHKVDADDQTSLPGAEFEVYQCADKDNLGEKIAIDHDNDPATDPISSWTTDENGNLVIDGLHVTDVENDAEQIDKTYCLVETKAPNGYELLTEPIEIKLVSSSLEQIGDDAYAVSHRATVENLESNRPKLPLTGGMGIGLVAAVGALIMGAGAAAAKRSGAKA